MMVYDPPSGWRYGFPKKYEPLPGESIEQTLLRDGYPQKEIAWGAAKHVRFMGTSAELDSLEVQMTKIHSGTQGE